MCVCVCVCVCVLRTFSHSSPFTLKDCFRKTCFPYVIIISIRNTLTLENRICDESKIDRHSADNDWTFLNRITTGEEAWCFLYDPKLKRQSVTCQRQYRQDTKTSAGQVKRQEDALTVFSFIETEMFIVFIPEGGTVIRTRYNEILGSLPNWIPSKRPEFWRRKNWQLLNVNSPAYRSVLVHV